MSHTNTTSNYDLPQFIGTDKPAWLTDVNGAMSAIDTQMKANADGNTTNAGNISALGTRVTTAEGAIETQAGQISTVSTLASNASTAASNANTKIDSLAEYLAINSFQNYSTTNVTSSNGQLSTAQWYVAKNSAGSLGKVYGYIGLTNLTTSGNVTVSANIDTGLRPTEEINIVNAGLAFLFDKTCVGVTMTVKTNGYLTFTFNALGQSSATLRLMPSLYFMTNFGDLPE